ncbi:Uncharacterised protein [Mycobacterium tuberculosis]|nr:Uncharacterised protein [Mycobacterium tuberculosis]COX39772.1 Uncharacterised protein [Mycobacterium tuberculosis]COX55452.1 Uncharacterised protein [Mycobacterium tuberculosis]
MSFMVPPCPWKTVMSALAMLFTFAGSNARNTGLKPPINASRSKAGDVRDNGMSPPGGSRSLAPLPSPRLSSTYRLPIRSE